MSTEWITIKDAQDPNVTLEFATGSSGYKLTLEWKRPNSMQLMKFWLTPESWEELRNTVDAMMPKKVTA